MLYLYCWLTSWLAQKEEEGQDLAEYALLIGLIAIIVFVAVRFLGTQISSIFSRLGSAVASWVIG